MGDSPDKNTVTDVDSKPAREDEGEVVEWTVHPVRRRWWVSVVVTLFVAAVGATVHAIMHSQFFTILALIIMLASLAKFYFPTTFRLSDKGVTVRTTTQKLFKEWKLYRSCYRDKKGLLLSPFVAPSRLENFRGLYVMFENNGDEVTEFARERIKRAHAKPEPDGEESSDDQTDSEAER